MPDAQQDHTKTKTPEPKGTSSPQPTAPPQKSRRTWIVLLIAGVIAIMMVVGVGFFGLLSQIPQSSIEGLFQDSHSLDYEASVQAMRDEPKTLVADQQPVALGPYTISYGSVQSYTHDQLPDTIKPKATSAAGNFLAVPVTITYDKQQTPVKVLAFGSIVAQPFLNGVEPIGTDPENIQNYDIVNRATSNPPHLTYVLFYEAPVEEGPLTLDYALDIYTKVSRFVGTEGSPVETINYHVTLAE